LESHGQRQEGEYIITSSPKEVWVADRQILLDNFTRHDGENVYS
jgi:hypothetical protein